MSYETTISNAASKAADYEWKSHRRGCVACSSSKGGRCLQGELLWAVARDARRELAGNRAADKLPTAGQEGLWG